MESTGQIESSTKIVRYPAAEPYDEHNQKLIQNVHPENWVNPEPNGRYNLVVIGGGTAGLVSAIGSVGLGAKVALIERELMGGDCLNVWMCAIEMCYPFGTRHA